MKVAKSLNHAFSGMGRSIGRYPFTMLYLIAITVLNGRAIQYSLTTFDRPLYTLIIGAMLSVVGQMLYERFFDKAHIRYLIMGGAVVLTLGYFFIMNVDVANDSVMSIKTAVILFALMITLIWIPTIKTDKVYFNQSFLATLKAFLTTFLFTLVLLFGIMAIYFTADTLLFDIDSDFLSHLINILSSLFTPLYFLSMVPFYPGKVDLNAEKQTLLKEQFTVPRFLNILTSYIVIPLTTIYTLILATYIISNLGGEFWTDNLMEPLLVSYAVIVIFVYLIAHNIDNKFTSAFCKFFPKILVPIMVFQTIASVLKIEEMGITHGRYYVIMFGTFATIAGIIFGYLKAKHYGLIAVSLLVLSALSIIPPVDAFTVSKHNQINLLEQTLTENNMLVDNQVVANTDIPTEDKIIITKVTSYLDSMDYDQDVSFIPDNNISANFSETFGFDRTYSEIDSSNPQYETTGQSAYLEIPPETVINITNHDVMLQQNYYHSLNDEQSLNQAPIDFEVNDHQYRLEAPFVNDYYTLTVKGASGQELISYDTKLVYDQLFSPDPEEYMNRTLNLEEATVITENEAVRLTMIVTSLNRSENTLDSSFYLLIDIK